MRSFSILSLSVVMAGSLTACQRPAPASDNSEVIAKLEEIDGKLDKLEKKVEKVSKSGGNDRKRNRRPRPDANTVYSVPVGDAPWKGTEHAKVTVVEAFEYA